VTSLSFCHFYWCAYWPSSSVKACQVLNGFAEILTADLVHDQASFDTLKQYLKQMTNQNLTM
jgi:hypothetical protein